MRNLLYKVGDETIASYTKAVEKAKQLNVDLEPFMEDYVEEHKVTDAERAYAEKKRNAIYQKAHEKCNADTAVES